MNPLLQLITCGQSYWLDNLTRDLITSGELQQRVAEQGLRGITSNPATFHKAIVGSRAYDGQIEQLVDEGHDVATLYERLIVTDIQLACDILQPVYKSSAGVDGFVSLEVSPYLAHDTPGSMQEARWLYTAVDRPNVLIKIPGTPAGLPAIEEMLYEGININITLLFAIADYEAVAGAYMRALERRLSAGKPLHNVASVASFFLSRIDVLVDQLLRQRMQSGGTPGEISHLERLLGQVAIANAKLAYQRFKQLFSSERWQRLADQGARVQRPLWASTSTKDPSYRDVMYIESLIAPNTVNTMPAETIAAFADHGRVVASAIETDLEEAHRVLHDLEQVGIDLHWVTWQLQDEGVQKFIEAFDALQQALAVKRQELLVEPVRHEHTT
jgi:transaldolase